ncbi:unnamed protein product [Rotaria sordida]|uniref:Uncharacterized protein n=1 Tax=Rotaria sordida TaxID=392033 RepID=A0A819SGX9_9BILA|nr:unnamed protein product [Rotaria sordida]
MKSTTLYIIKVLIIKHYIKPQTAIVLHVIPSFVDFTISESIQLTLKDERQLITVSKIDKYDKGIRDKFQGIGPGSMALKLGCIAMLNRTQEEIEQNISFDEIQRHEQEFFRTNKKHLKMYRNDILGPLYTDLIKKYREIINARVNGVYDNEMQLKIEEPIFTTTNLSRTTSITQTSNDRFDEQIAFQLYNRQRECRDKLHNSFTDFFSTEYQRMVLKLLEENAGVALRNFSLFSIIERLYHAEQNKFRKPCEDLIESYSEYSKRVFIKILNQIFAEETSYKHQIIHKLTDVILCAIDESET